jgi:hypothetical protein
MTFWSRLVKLVLKVEYVSGCHVLRLHASSAALEIDSLLDQVEPLVDVVGLESMLLPGEYAPELDVFNCPRSGGPYEVP